MQAHENTRSRGQRMHIQGSLVNDKIKVWIGLFLVILLELISSLPAMTMPCGSETDDIFNAVPLKAMLIFILGLIICILKGLNILPAIVKTLCRVAVGSIVLIVLYEFIKIFAAIADGNFDKMKPFCKLPIIVSPICGLLQLSMLLEIYVRLKQEERNVDNPNARESLLQFNTMENIYMLFLGWTLLCVSSAAQVVATLCFGQAVDAALDTKGDPSPQLEYIGGAGLVGCLCTMCRCWLLNRSDLRTVVRIRQQLLDEIRNNTESVFEQFKKERLSRILTFDTQALPNKATSSKSVRYLLQMFGSLVGLFILNAFLTLCVLGAILVVSLTSIFFGYHINKLQIESKNRLTSYQETALTELTRLSNDLSYSQASPSELRDGAQKTENKLIMLGVVTEGALGSLLTAAAVAILYYGGTLLNKHAINPEEGISAGELTAFVLFLVQMGFACGFTLWSYGEPNQKILEARKRLTELREFLRNRRPD